MREGQNANRRIHLFRYGIHEVLRGGDRQGYPDALERGTGFLADGLPHAVDGAIFVICGQHGVPGTNWQRAGDKVHAVSCVADKGDLVGITAQELGKADPCQVDLFREMPLQGIHRLELEFTLVALVCCKYRAGAGAE